MIEKLKGKELVQFTTNHGVFKIKLNAEKAPISVENFIGYVESGHYNGTIFHRVIDGFMVQGGGFDAEMNQKPTGAGIKNESDNGLKNTPMTVAMARTQDPDSATAQFFVNLIDNAYLNGGSKPGYAVFGEVVEGKEVIEKIAKVKTGSVGMFDDVPLETVIIEKAEVL